MKPIILWRHVIWDKPLVGLIKININGSYDISSGKAGIGSIIRNYNSNIIMGFSLAIQCASNNYVEAVAANYVKSEMVH